MKSWSTRIEGALTFGELKWDVLSSSQKTCRITNDNNAIEEWTFEKGGTCHTCVTHFGLQFTFHRKSRVRRSGGRRGIGRYGGWGSLFEGIYSAPARSMIQKSSRSNTT